MAQRCICILLAERHHKFHAADIASELAQNSCEGTFEDHCSTIKSMVTLGSYYQSLETWLGRGVTLALGTDIAEDT
jgi:hypothetical protein